MTAPVARPEPHERSGGHFGIGLGVVFTVVVLVMYRPSWSSMTGTLPWNLGDPALNTWILSWESHALLHDVGGFFDGNIFYPFGSSILYSEMMLPLVPVFATVLALGGSAVFAHNLIVILLSILCLVTTYLLARRLIGHRGVAVLAAFVFSFSGYVFEHMSHLQLLTLGSFPLAFLLLFVALETQRIRDGVLLGLATFALATACLYYGAIWALCLVSVLAVELVRRRGHPGAAWWRTVGAAALTAGVLLIPLALVYLQFQSTAGFQRPMVAAYGLKLRDLVAPAPGTWLYQSLYERAVRVEAAPVEHGFFLGFVALALAIAGLVAAFVHWRVAADGGRARREPVPGARWHELGLLGVGAVVSLSMAVGATVLGVPGPFRFFYRFVPGFDSMQAVSRLAVPALLFAAVLAALGLQWLLRVAAPGLRVVVKIAVCVGVLAELYVTPIRHPVDSSEPRLAVYERLEQLPPGPVVELPIPVPGDTGAPPLVEGPRMLSSIGDWRPRVNGYSGAYPDGYAELASVLNDFPDQRAVERVRAEGVRYIVIHMGSGPDRSYPAEVAQAIVEARPPGATAEQIGSDWLVTLP